MFLVDLSRLISQNFFVAETRLDLSVLDNLRTLRVSLCSCDFQPPFFLILAFFCPLLLFADDKH